MGEGELDFGQTCGVADALVALLLLSARETRGIDLTERSGAAVDGELSAL